MVCWMHSSPRSMAFGDREARRGFGSSFGNILKFGFELKNMVCHIFWPKAKRSKAAHGKRPQEQEHAAVEDLNGGYRREALGVGRLSRRRHSCTEGRPWVQNGSGVARQAKGVILSEPGCA